MVSGGVGSLTALQTPRDNLEMQGHALKFMNENKPNPKPNVDRSSNHF